MKSEALKPTLTFEVLEKLTTHDGKISVNLKRKEKVDFSALTCEEKRKVLQALSTTDFLFT